MDDCRVRVQCRDTVNKDLFGTYLVVNGERVGPLFSSLAQLLPWMHTNGYEMQEYHDGGFTPWRAGRIADRLNSAKF